MKSRSERDRCKETTLHNSSYSLQHSLFGIVNGKDHTKIIYTNFKFLIVEIWQNSNVKLPTWECGPSHVNLGIGQCWLHNFGKVGVGKEETSTWAMCTSQFGKVELANMKIQLRKNLSIWYSITILVQQFKSPFLLTLSIVNFLTKENSLITHYSIWRRTITFEGERGGERKNTPKLWKHWQTCLHGLLIPT
jgi:hypothetical protein